MGSKMNNREHGDKTPRVKIYLNGQVSQVDMFFLDALSLKHFGEKYEDCSEKKEVRKIVRDMMAGTVVNTQAIHQKILLSFLPEEVRNKID